MKNFLNAILNLTQKAQPNDAVRYRLVDFLVFNSAFGRCSNYSVPITSSFVVHPECRHMHRQCIQDAQIVMSVNIDEDKIGVRLDIT